MLYLKEQCLEIFYTKKELCCVISGCACFVLCVVCTKMQQFKGTVSRDFEMPMTQKCKHSNFAYSIMSMSKGFKSYEPHLLNFVDIYCINKFYILM